MLGESNPYDRLNRLLSPGDEVFAMIDDSPVREDDEATNELLRDLWGWGDLTDEQIIRVAYTYVAIRQAWEMQHEPKLVFTLLAQIGASIVRRYEAEYSGVTQAERDLLLASQEELRPLVSLVGGEQIFTELVESCGIPEGSADWKRLQHLLKCWARSGDETECRLHAVQLLNRGGFTQRMKSSDPVFAALSRIADEVFFGANVLELSQKRIDLGN